MILLMKDHPLFMEFSQQILDILEFVLTIPYLLVISSNYQSLA